MKVFSILSTLIISMILSCSQVSADSYEAAKEEGRAAARKFIDRHAATAITIALVDRKHIIWSESFGVADPGAGNALTDTTMFGIGSVSKMFATVAVMKLVDQGLIDLDTPLVTYLPDFKMASPEYKNITVRMLLNHSAGFPGTDYRNALIRTPVPGYPNQMMQTLSTARLKAPPGYMSVYCNDCFTIIGPLIEARTGKSYARFVQDEILTPLAMNHSRYPVEAFPDDSYAKATTAQGVLKPQEFINTFASGALYSTANDMARFAMMFLNKGTLDSVQILSEKSVEEMAVDQTAKSKSFNPIVNKAFIYGLGWDSVSQPGLKAVGYDGWGKCGDSNDYGAMLIVSPKAGLGVVVIGASGFSSEQAKAVAEKVLLRALAENGKIAKFPAPLSTDEIEASQPAQASAAMINGEYASYALIMKFVMRPDQALLASAQSLTGWKPAAPPMKIFNGGWFKNPKEPMRTFEIVNASLLGKPTRFLVSRSPGGHGHYLDYSVFAEQVQKKSGKLAAAWKARLPLTWLVVNEHPDELAWNDMDPRLRLSTVPELNGYIAVTPPVAPTHFQLLDPVSSNKAIMMLVIPQTEGRDLDDLEFVKLQGKEWARFGSYMHQPLDSVLKLASGKTETITIGPEGYAEWRSIAGSLQPVRITLMTTGSWRLYDSDFKSVAGGKGDGVATLPARIGKAYLTLFGEPGQTVTVSVQKADRS